MKRSMFSRWENMDLVSSVWDNRNTEHRTQGESTKPGSLRMVNGSRGQSFSPRSQPSSAPSAFQKIAFIATVPSPRFKVLSASSASSAFQKIAFIATVSSPAQALFCILASLPALSLSKGVRLLLPLLQELFSS